MPIEQKLEWTRDLIKELGITVSNARWLHFSFTASAVASIKSTIVSNKLYRVIGQNRNIVAEKCDHQLDFSCKKERRDLQRACFLESFLTDENMPENVRKAILCLIGLYRGANLEDTEVETQHYQCAVSELQLQEFFIKRWMETCH